LLLAYKVRFFSSNKTAFLLVYVTYLTFAIIKINIVNMTIVEELKWRGLLHDIMPGTEELLNTKKIASYCGFDPTSDSLHIGNLVPILLLMHLQKNGHTAIALVGGATGMVGDPSGKSAERNLLDIATLRHNEAGIKAVLQRFLNFDASIANPAEIVNNFDWFKDFSFLDFIRDVGKHITVNYMMSKDSVQKRMEGGMSFTEFSYQLIQGFDFYYLWKNKNVQLQAAGSDQWGNIVTGTELIRRIGGGEGFAFTAPLITKADGSKFGKSESGNVWLTADKTSPFQFYQFWINTSDTDAEKYIKIFTFLEPSLIEKLITEHQLDASKRVLQKQLAEEVTTLVHGAEGFATAVNTTQKLFASNTIEGLLALTETEFTECFEGVPTYTIGTDKLTNSDNYVNILADSGILPSKSEAKKLIQGGGISVNKVKLSGIEQKIAATDVLHGKYILVQKGKNNNYLLIIQ
jgi:tyrosyl-tRNA synthetase